MLVVAVAAVVVAIMMRPPPPVVADALEGRLELAAGEVLVDDGSGARRVVSGSALPPKVRVTTGAGARALVRASNGSALFLRADTSLGLEASEVRLEQGEYWLDAVASERQPLRHHAGDVQVAAAEAGVSIRREAEKVLVYVARGAATVTAGKGRVEVRAGEQAMVAKDGVPRVTPLEFWEDWTGGMADASSGLELPGAGTGTIYAVDDGAPAGSPASPLDVSRQVVRATVREGVSETEVDQTFFNPGERSVEGWYWFTLPEAASVTGFALETDGRLIEGEFIERREAAAQYSAAKASGHAPAILEYVDGRSYRARIYPIAAGATRRVVLRYIELRPVIDDTVEYVYPMGAGKPVRIGEFALTVNLGDAGKKMKISTLAEARVEDGGTRVTMRRSGYTPRSGFQLEAKLPKERPALTVARFRPNHEAADYVMARYLPDVEWHELPATRADVIVVVDTSAGGDESTHRLKLAAAEATLRALSAGDHFAVMSLDVRPTLLYPQEKLAVASEAEIGKALEVLAARPAGGATDLAAMFEVAVERLHGAEQPAIVYIGDGLATSGDLDGERLVERLRRVLTTSRARFFALPVGSDADVGVLGALARAGGGESFRLDELEHTTSRALELAAAIKRPTITDLQIDFGAGLDEVFLSATGKLSRGQELVLLARTHHELPSRIKVKGRLAGKPLEREYDVELDDTVMSALVPRFWAAEQVRRWLGEGRGADAERGRIAKLGIDYGLMTPYTSLLALESELAYEQMGIKRGGSPLRGVRLGALDVAAERELLAALGAVPVAMAWGCSRSEAPSEQREVAASAPPPPTQLSVEESSVPSGAASAAAAMGDMAAAEPPVAAPAPTVGIEALKPSAAPSPRVSSGGGAMRRAKKGGLGRRLGGAPTSPRPDAELEAQGLTGPGELAKAKEASAGARPSLRPIIPARCSDAAAQPLATRALLWWKRLRAANSAEELIERHVAASRACELGDWRAERVFLDLLQRRIATAATAQAVLDHFAPRRDVQKHLAKLILRRTVEPELVAAVKRALFEKVNNWLEVDLELQAIKAPEERLRRLREIVSHNPDDPEGMVRLIRLLLETEQRDEALALARKLRSEGLFTPLVVRQLGDLLAQTGLSEEAIRTYSEIVEFDAQSRGSRRLLGDIYLARQWYEPAYRQYRMLTEAAADDALSWLRLASAAAGAGRVDEALRIERQVANAQGTPGADDPRRWSRLWSAARLARLLEKGAGPEHQTRARQLERELNELQLFSAPSTLVILTWEDLGAQLSLAAEREGQAVALGDVTHAHAVGLSSAMMPTTDAERAAFVAQTSGAAPSVALPLMFHRITWDGRAFRVNVAQRRLERGEHRLTL